MHAEEEKLINYLNFGFLENPKSVTGWDISMEPKGRGTDFHPTGTKFKGHMINTTSCKLCTNSYFGKICLQ